MMYETSWGEFENQESWMDTNEVLQASFRNPIIRKQRKDVLVHRLKGKIKHCQHQNRSGRLKVAFVRSLVLPSTIESRSVSPKELGQAVKAAFPNACRKRIHSCWYYCGIQEISTCQSSTQTKVVHNEIISNVREEQSEKKDVHSTKPFKIPSLNMCKEDLIYNVNNFISEGTFGKCFQGEYKGLPIAVKQFKAQQNYRWVHREAEILTRIPSHPNIAMLIGVFTEKEPFVLATKLYTINGKPQTFCSLLKEHKITLPLNSFLQSLCAIANGICHIHKNKVLHNDIKANNIVIQENKGIICPVLIDFGKAIFVHEARGSIHKQQLSVTERDNLRKKYPHIAPEVAQGKPPSEISDTYSFGYIFCCTMKFLNNGKNLATKDSIC